MKLSYKIFLLTLLSLSSSCAWIWNSKTVDVSINSNPQGADIFIEGRNYGRTPATINIEPKNYSVTLTKEGYGSAQLELESWVAIRNKKGDGGRCLADALGSMLVIPMYSFYWSGGCLDFKQASYSVNIPYISGNNNVSSGGNSMMGLGRNPSDMVDYYYRQDTEAGNRMQRPEMQLPPGRRF